MYNIGDLFRVIRIVELDQLDQQTKQMYEAQIGKIGKLLHYSYQRPECTLEFESGDIEVFFCEEVELCFKT